MAEYNVALKTGDIALYRRDGLIGTMITWFTGGDKSHAGIILVDGGRHYVLDARSPHVDVRPISVDVSDGYTIKVARAPKYVQWREPALLDFAYQIEGAAHYATWKMLANIWTEWFGCPDGLLDPVEIPNRFHCSELASCCCRLFGWMDAGLPEPIEIPYDPCPGRPDRYTTPRDLDDRSSLVTVTDRLGFAGAKE